MDTPHYEILNLLVEWGKHNFLSDILAASQAQGGRTDVCVQLMLRNTQSVTTLFNELNMRYGEEEVVTFMKEVLALDPSQTQKGLIFFDEMLHEKPFPRFVVTLVYLIILECFHDTQSSLAESAWSNIIRCKHQFWPELLVDVLGRLLSKEALVKRAVYCIASESAFERTLGDDIIYGLRITDEQVSQLIEQVISNGTDKKHLARYIEYANQRKKNHLKRKAAKVLSRVLGI